MNQEQNSPFKVGDVVYHAYHGKVEVNEIDNTDICLSTLTATHGWFNHMELSYEPWPKPVHVRPIKVGW